MKLKKNDEANNLVPKFKRIDRTLDKVELVCTKTNGAKYGFSPFAFPLKFIEKIHNYEITLDEAIKDKIKLVILISNYNQQQNNY